MAPVFAVTALTFVVSKFLWKNFFAEAMLMHTVSPTAKQIQINIWLLAPNEGRHCIDFGFIATCMSLKIGIHLNSSGSHKTTLWVFKST